MFDKTTKILIEKFFDGTLTPAERSALDRLAFSDPALRRRLEDDAMVRSLLCSVSEREFGVSFVDEVVRDIQEEAALSKLLAANKPQAFKAGFQRRVIDMIIMERAEAGLLFNRDLSEFLSRLFPKFAAPVALAASFAMVANANAAVAGAPIIDALLGLPSEYASEYSFLYLE